LLQEVDYLLYFTLYHFQELLSKPVSEPQIHLENSSFVSSKISKFVAFSERLSGVISDLRVQR
jgi:hypothetical protein